MVILMAHQLFAERFQRKDGGGKLTTDLPASLREALQAGEDDKHR